MMKNCKWICSLFTLMWLRWHMKFMQFMFVNCRKLEEKCSFMESRLFQLENKNESIDCDIENMPIDKTIVMTDKSKAVDVISKPSLPKQSVRIDFSKTVSKCHIISIRTRFYSSIQFNSIIFTIFVYPNTFRSRHQHWIFDPVVLPVYRHCWNAPKPKNRINCHQRMTSQKHFRFWKNRVCWTGICENLTLDHIVSHSKVFQNNSCAVYSCRSFKILVA